MLRSSPRSFAGAHAPSASERFDRLFASRPVVLAPMEEVTDAVFRRICRGLGAELCVTEFVNVEGLLRGCRKAARKIGLAADDQPTAIQIYGSDPGRLCEAAAVAVEARPAFIDINCGCWVSKIARRGAGAGWLRDPAAMVAMARLVVDRVPLPVTVKTRIGLADEAEMPIVDLARRLEDVGVRALTLHCRTVKAGLRGPADWSWALRVREAVRMPVVLNGDVRSAEDAARAFATTGVAGVMIGRRAIEHPWIFREARALLGWSCAGSISRAPSGRAASHAASTPCAGTSGATSTASAALRCCALAFLPATPFRAASTFCARPRGISAVRPTVRRGPRAERRIVSDAAAASPPVGAGTRPHGQGRAPAGARAGGTKHEASPRRGFVVAVAVSRVL
jgi:tRNA-dihydrouridine synthase B